jgi:hypothetical protein
VFDGEMPNCVDFEKLSYNIEVTSADGNNILTKSQGKRQPPRPKDLVEKLPKVIFSFVEHLDNNEYEQVIIEYEGIYNYNDAFSKVGLENLLDFIKDSYEKYLNITKLQDFKNSGEDEVSYHQENNDSDHNFNNNTYTNASGGLLEDSYNNINIRKCSKCPFYYND